MIDNPGAITGSISASVADELLATSTPITATFAPVPIGDLIIYNGSKQYKFIPKEDITAYESVRLAQMFAFGSSGRPNYNFYGFIVQHKLERHFEECV